MAILSVSELNRRAAERIQDSYQMKLLLIEGEISNLRKSDSGHLYFSLRDAQSTVKAMMFRQSAGQLRFVPENGMLVLAAANAGIYPEGGMFQLYVTDMLFQGEGGVYRGMHQKKEMLRVEGLLDKAVKKAIPPDPKKIGLITSPSGAAVQDMLQILTRRAPSAEVTVFPVQVQGKHAESDICHALADADAQGLDVLILGRGGGSAEHLEIFNSEKIVRAIHACQTPVISAVGHETDFTLTDDAADLRAPTPSAGAELASSRQYPEILTEDNQKILSVRQVKAGELLKISLPDGIIIVRAESEDNNDE